MYSVNQKIFWIFKKTVFVTNNLIEAIDFCQNNRNCEIMAGKQVIKYKEFGWVS